MRVANMTAEQKCGWCRDEGLVVVGTRAEGHGRMEEHGPCPYCERGYQVEFPERTSPQWGKGGYWRGRSPDIQPAEPESDWLSNFENGMRLRLMYARLTRRPNADPAEGLHLPERERLELLKQRVMEPET